MLAFLVDLLWSAWRKITNNHSVPPDAPGDPISEGQTPPVTGEVESGTDDYISTMNFWLDVLLRLPGFPQTDEDAENILRFVRSQRDECRLTKEAAEQALHQCILQIQVLQRTPDTYNATVLRLADLERRQETLAQAEEALAAAELRVGAVRDLLRRKVLPLIFPHGAGFRGFPPRARFVVDNGYASDDSDHSVAYLSDTGWDQTRRAGSDGVV